MAGPGDLYLLLREYLDACAEAIILSPAGGAIGRAYVAPGPPAWDCCPQLTVHAGGPAEADTLPLQPPLQPGRRAASEGPGAVHLVNMTATVLRCAPVVGESLQLPQASDIEAAAQATLGDVWAIWNHVRNRYRARTLFARADGQQRELFFDPAVAVLTQGGCAGWQIQIRVQLDGYEERL